MKMQLICFFLKEEAGMRDLTVTGVQTCALPILGLFPLLCRILGGAVKSLAHGVKAPDPALQLLEKVFLADIAFLVVLLGHGVKGVVYLARYVRGVLHARELGLLF